MQSNVSFLSSAAPTGSPASKAGIALGIGLAGIALTAIGFFVSDPRSVALSWLVAVGYWTLIVVGMLILVLLHHIFDASWGIVIRRQFEHWLAAFKWLLLLFLPLLAVSAWLRPGLVWLWMNPRSVLPGTQETVGEDILYLKKSGYLNVGFFSAAAGRLLRNLDLAGVRDAPQFVPPGRRRRSEVDAVEPVLGGGGSAAQPGSRSRSPRSTGSRALSTTGSPPSTACISSPPACGARSRWACWSRSGCTAGATTAGFSMATTCTRSASWR